MIAKQITLKPIQSVNLNVFYCSPQSDMRLISCLKPGEQNSWPVPRKAIFSFPTFYKRPLSSLCLPLPKEKLWHILMFKIWVQQGRQNCILPLFGTNLKLVTIVYSLVFWYKKFWHIENTLLVSREHCYTEQTNVACVIDWTRCLSVVPGRLWCVHWQNTSGCYKNIGGLRDTGSDIVGHGCGWSGKSIACFLYMKNW